MKRTTNKKKSSNNPITIADLPSDEKQKVSRLIEKLISLGQQHEETLATLENERARHTDINHNVEQNILIIEERISSKDREISTLENKLIMATGLLALYQAKLRNTAEGFRLCAASEDKSIIRINQLERDIGSMQSLISSQNSTIESFEKHQHIIQNIQKQNNVKHFHLDKELQRYKQILIEKDIQINRLDYLGQQLATEMSVIQEKYFELQHKYDMITNEFNYLKAKHSDGGSENLERDVDFTSKQAVESNKESHKLQNRNNNNIVNEFNIRSMSVKTFIPAGDDEDKVIYRSDGDEEDDNDRRHDSNSKFAQMYSSTSLDDSSSSIQLKSNSNVDSKNILKTVTITPLLQPKQNSEAIQNNHNNDNSDIDAVLYNNNEEYQLNTTNSIDDGASTMAGIAIEKLNYSRDDNIYSTRGSTGIVFHENNSKDNAINNSKYMNRVADQNNINNSSTAAATTLVLHVQLPQPNFSDLLPSTKEQPSSRSPATVKRVPQQLYDNEDDVIIVKQQSQNKTNKSIVASTQNSSSDAISINDINTLFIRNGKFNVKEQRYTNISDNEDAEVPVDVSFQSSASSINSSIADSGIRGSDSRSYRSTSVKETIGGDVKMRHQEEVLDKRKHHDEKKIFKLSANGRDKTNYQGELNDHLRKSLHMVKPSKNVVNGISKNFKVDAHAGNDILLASARSNAIHKQSHRYPFLQQQYDESFFHLIDEI